LATAVALDRRLTPFAAALFGLSYICPTVVISTFGVLSIDTRGATASAYVIATLAMLLTAVSYGRMAARYPESGSAYTYVSRTTNPTLGFITGWVLILDYLFVPMVICLFTAKALELVAPGISYRWWVVLIAATTTVINILGIQVTNRVNLTIMAAQLAVIGGLILCCIAFLLAQPRGSHAWTLAPFANPLTSLPGVMSGATIAAYSFLGFDAVTTLSEETINPVKSIPRATIFAAAASGIIYVVTSYLMGLVHPSLVFHDVDNAGYEVMALVSGRAFALMLAIVLIAYTASVMCAQAGSSRLLYAMGRDDMLPSSRLFGFLHARRRTPVANIVLIGCVMLIGEWIDVETAASCVNFGAFCAFFAVNACVAADSVSGTRSLAGGRRTLVLATAGAAAAAWLVVSLHAAALVIGAAWLSLGVGYLAIRTRGFKHLLVRSVSQADRAAGSPEI
jgi:putrescine importer